MKPISEALSELMDARQMTPTDVWAAAGITHATLSRYLHGFRGIVLDHRGAETVCKLARVFGVTPDYFVEYRAWRVREIARTNPELVEPLYDVLIGSARLRGIVDEGLKEIE